jgi:hypothetical protein
MASRGREVNSKREEVCLMAVRNPERMGIKWGNGAQVPICNTSFTDFPGIVQERLAGSLLQGEQAPRERYTV